MRTSSPDPPVEELKSWVTWRTQMHDKPGWWEELAKVPGVDEPKKLAQEVCTFFQLPQRISKWHWVENYHQAPPAPPCLHLKNFLLPSDSKFACQDIRELQWRTWWLTPKPSSFGQKKPICLLRANHTFWRGT